MISRNKRRRSSLRSATRLIEQLEERTLLAADWRNPANPHDVNHDTYVTPIDALIIINDLNRGGPSELGPRPNEEVPTLPYFDVNGDGHRAPLDVLLIINELNRTAKVPVFRINEGQSFSAELTNLISLGQTAGARTVRLEIAATFDTSDNASLLKDTFQIYLVDPALKSQTILDRGAGTALFSMNEAGADYQPGRVRFDGSVVEIDVTPLESRSEGLLKFQLLSGDTDTQSAIELRPLSNVVDSTLSAGPVFPLTTAPVNAGPALDLSTLQATSNIEAIPSNPRFDTASGIFEFELRLRSDAPSTGRNAVAVLSGLPSGTSVQSPSGVDQNGNPYISFRNAIPPGGLVSGEESTGVLVRVNNPTGLALPITAQVLAGSANRAPIFPAVTPFSVFPGGKLVIPFGASDPDGDGLEYSIRSDEPIPTGVLAAGGLLTLSPTLADLGTHVFSVIADDGALRTEQTFTVHVVPDVVTTTRVSGFVQDAGLGQPPLAGVPIEMTLGDGTILAQNVVTASDGSFNIEFLAPTTAEQLHDVTIKIRGEALGGQPGDPVFPFIAEKMHLLLDRDVIPGVNNVVARPIYLPALNPGEPVISVPDPVNPIQLISRVLQQGEAPAVVGVTKGSLLDQQGLPFTGDLGITEVPNDYTPAALPPNLIPDIVVTIQPGEMVFTVPALLTLPNRAGYAPGTVMDLWSINPVTGLFDDVGDAIVRADGSSVDTVRGGIRNSSWHFFAPPPALSNNPQNNGRNQNNSCEECPPATAPIGSEVELHSGTLHEWHDLVTYQSQGTARRVSLHYDSLRADPRPIVHFDYSNVRSGADQRLIATYTIGLADILGYEGSPTRSANHYWSIPDGGLVNIDAAMQTNLRSAPSGNYRYQINSGVMRYDGTQFFGAMSPQSTGTLLHVNSIESPFGSGWGMAGLLELVVSPDDSVMIIDGDGSELLFTAPAQLAQQPRPVTFISPPGDFSRLELLDNGTYRRTMKDQTVYQFNADHKLETMRDRNANITRYAYNNGIIASITDPVGLVTQFSQVDGRITSITDPAGRTTVLEHDTNGDLISVRDPDQSTRAWQYDGAHRMTQETDQRGYVEQTFFDFAGRVTHAIAKDGTERHVTNVQTIGLFPSDQTESPANSPVAVRTGIVEAYFVDASGIVVKNALDQAGQTTSQTDASGKGETVVRNSQNQIITLRNGRDIPTRFSWEGSGNLREVISLIDLPGTDEGASRFPSPAYLTTGTVFDSVAGDINNDGFIDIVVSQAPNTLTFQLGNGRGDLESSRTIVLDGVQNGSVSKLELGDINEDGWLDIISTGSIGLSDANGNFVFTRVLGGSTPVQLADMNGDSHLDIFTHSTDSVTIKLGDGNGSFPSSVSYPLNGFGMGIAVTSGVVGDLNGDELPDVILGRSNNFNINQISWLFGQPDGSLGAVVSTAISNVPQVISSADFNLDGRLDVVYAAPTTGRLGIMFQAEGGDFNTSFLDTPRAFADDLIVGDVSGDGTPDIVVRNAAPPYSDKELATFVNDGTGAFVRTISFYEDPLRPIDVQQIVDWNGDQQSDLLVIRGKHVAVLQGRGLAQFAPIQFHPESRFSALASADLDGDGVQELLAASSTAFGVRVFDTRDNQLVDAATLSTGVISGQMIVSDLNNDDVPDIVHLGLSSLSISLGDGNGGIRPPTIRTIPTNATALRVADVTLDSYPDILIAHAIAGSPRITLVINDRSGGFSASEDIALTTAPQNLAMGDFNNDGQPDILVSSPTTDTISLLDGRGAGRFSAPRPFVVGDSPDAIAVGDLNGDSYLDVVVANTASQTVSVLLNDASGSFVQNVVDGQFLVRDIVTKDVNGDNVLDLTLSEVSGVIELLIGYGDGHFIRQESSFVGGLLIPDFLFVDANLDGKDDLFAASDRGILALYGQGTGIQTVVRESFEYDSQYNQLTSVTDELGHKTLYEIDPANGNRLSMTQVIGAIGGDDDLVANYTYTPSGQVDRVTDPNGVSTDYDYDLFGRVASITFALGTADQATRLFEYDMSTTAGRAGLITTSIDELGRRTLFEYDVMNRLTRTIEPDPDGPAEPLLSPETAFEFDTVGNLLGTVDANGNETRHEYDPMSRRIRLIEADPDGDAGPAVSPVTDFSLDAVGNLKAVTDPNRLVTRYEYDSRNRRVRSIDPDGGITRFRFDFDDNLISLTDPVGNRTAFSYDQRNRMTKETDPLGKAIRYTYDPADRLIAKIDRNGRTSRFAYDDANRLLTETWIGADQSIENVVNYVHDESGSLLSAYDVQSSLAFTYDLRYRVDTVDNRGSLPVQGTPGAPRVILDYNYDLAGNVTSLADTINGASSATTSYGHDALNRVTTITQVGAGIADKRIHYGYNPLGQYAAIERYRDLAATELVVGTNYTYDDLNRLDEMRHNNANGATLNFHNLDYDIASRITRITDIDGTHDYAYDDRNQLIGASHETISIPDETYEFDANGNRLNSHLHGSGYVTGPGNRLLSDGIYNYEYDDEGNTVKRTRIAGTEPDGSTIRDFEWDHRNRLVSVTDKQPDGTATQVVRFTYDALDRRISKSVDNTPGNAVDAAILHFINDREDVLLDFLDGDGSGPEPPVLSQRYLHGPGIDQVLAQDDGAGTVHWHLADHLGTVKDLVDQTGAVANHINYDSFGSMVAETNAAVTSRYGFTGREWDEELSLQHNRARRYDATNGRFVGEDSLRFRWGLNLFMYALNSPVEVVDPSGRGPQATPTVPPVALPTPDYHLAPFYDPITPPIDPNVEYESCVDGCTNFMGGLTTACVILPPNIKLIHRFLIGVGMSMSTTASCESICWKYYLPTPASSNGSIP